MVKAIVIILIFSMLACGGKKQSTSSETKKGDNNTSHEEKEKEKDKQEMIVNINDVAMKNKSDVEKVFGKPTKTETVVGKYPCKDGSCEKIFYNNDSYEVFFRDDKAFRITLNNLGKFAFGEDNIEQLGLKKQKPAKKDDKFVITWKNISGFYEVSSFSNGDGKIDYVLVIVTETK